MNIEKLNEKNLFDVIATLFSEHANKIESQKRIKTKIRTFIPDYYLDTGEHIFMFEFDGPHHFTSTKTQIRDIALSDYCINHDIFLIRIPYFLQIDSGTLPGLFPQFIIDHYDLYDHIGNITTEYVSGFHDSKIVFPADFNEYGFEIFNKIYLSFVDVDRLSVMRQIYKSLINEKYTPLETLGINFVYNKNKKNLFENYPT